MTIKDVSQKEIDALIDRLQAAIDHDLSVEKDDLILLMQLVETLTHLQDKMNEKDMTLIKLKRLLGMLPKSEKRKRDGSNNSGDGQPRNQSSTKQKKKKRGKGGRGPTKNPPVEHHKHQMKNGDACPECHGMGRVYPLAPQELVRVSAHEPLEGTKHVIEQCRCNRCGKVFKADVPDSLLNDGPLNQKYGYSAQVAMALEKFLSGTPYYHQSYRLAIGGISVAASTIYDQVAAVANKLSPLAQHIRTLAAKSMLLLYDDTHHNILTQAPEVRPNRNGKGERLRTGVYCSLVIGKDGCREYVIYEISLGHVGELVDEILKLRPEGYQAVLTMSDAASVNRPTVGKSINGLCNSHGRRQFDYAKENFPAECDHILDLYGKIWINEDHCVEQKMTDDQRLIYHREHSLPIMSAIYDWGQAYINSDQYEQHSMLGRAVRYFMNHFEGLTKFCEVPGMVIDNNRPEETLKLPIRGRKLSYFFKTAKGAEVASINLSVIMTCVRADVNPCDYLVAVLRYSDAVAEHPENWMPWNYHLEVERLKSLRENDLAA